MKNKKKPVGATPASVSQTPHPRSDELAASIERCQAVAFAETFIRVAGMDYANRDDLLTGDGSLKHGGRYNPKGGFRAIYGSLELDTATAELLAHHRHQGRPDPEADVFPLVAVSLQAEVERLLDLTHTAIRRVLKVSLKDLVGDWQNTQDLGQEALTQAIGRLARAAGYQGLLAPSAASQGGGTLSCSGTTFPRTSCRSSARTSCPRKLEVGVGYKMMVEGDRQLVPGGQYHDDREREPGQGTAAGEDAPGPSGSASRGLCRPFADSP